MRRNVLRSCSGGAHAYVASPRLLAWLRDHPFGTAPFVRLAGTGIDAAYAALPGAYALFPMLATQSGVAGDHLADGARRKLKKPEHLFSRWRHRERLLAGLTRPSELAAAAPLALVLRPGPPRPAPARAPSGSSNATTAREAEARTRLPPGGSAGLDRGVLRTHGPLPTAPGGTPD